jgi:uncharacterized protein (TIGR02246 family)
MRVGAELRVAGLSMPRGVALSHECADVDRAFHQWIEAISGDGAHQIVDLYNPDAVLIATLSSTPVTTQRERAIYFSNLLANPNLRVELGECTRHVEGGIAFKQGIYTFCFDGSSGEPRRLTCFFTFIYKREGARWMIVHHHSSPVDGHRMPQW